MRVVEDLPQGDDVVVELHPGMAGDGSDNALDDAMAALVIEVVSSGVTSIDTLLLNDNLLTWMSCDRMGPLLKRRPVSPGSPLHPKPLATLQVLPALPRLFFRTMRSCARPR